jgi:SpoIID/LytB domain protein
VRDRRRRLLTLLVAVLTGLVVAAPATGQDPAPVDLGVYGAPIRFAAPEGVTIELGSGRRLVDTLEVRPHPGGAGVVVIAEMDMEDYVAGIAEMPAGWPLDALKAQAVAARTYAWYQITRGTFERRGLGYDMCPTVACQVFRGREIVETPGVGQNWQRAVDETAGEVLLWDGAPILARYFSTSGGATRNNEDVFPSEGPYPYLKGIDDPDDAVSPVHRWEAVFTRAQFDDLLSRGQTLAAAAPIADAVVDKRPGGEPDVVRVTGRDGEVVEVTAGQLRDFLNDTAPANFPDDFPGPRSDGRRLPSTVPSSRFEIVVTDDHVRLDGSGWGHGVGLGQYGAKGKAERGLTYRDILATYYNGLQPETPDALPDRIRVGLADDAADLTIAADGPLTVTVGETTITDRALGTWSIATAPDRTVRLQAPTGYGAPLVVDTTTTSRARPLAVETVQLETVVNKSTELALQVRRDGEVVGQRDLGIVAAGRHTIPWPLDTDAGDLVPGTYDVALLATDEEGAVAGGPATVEVVAVTAPGPATSLLAPLDPTPRPQPPWALLVLAGLAGAAAGAVAGRVLGAGRREVAG